MLNDRLLAAGFNLSFFMKLNPHESMTSSIYNCLCRTYVSRGSEGILIFDPAHFPFNNVDQDQA